MGAEMVRNVRSAIVHALNPSLEYSLFLAFCFEIITDSWQVAEENVKGGTEYCSRFAPCHRTEHNIPPGTRQMLDLF